MQVVFLRSNPVNPDPRVEKEVQSLQNAGINTEIVCWDREESNEIDTDLKALGSHLVKIHRFNIPASFGAGLNNLIPLLKWQVTLIKWLFKNRKNYDVIHACDFDTVLPAILMKQFFRKKVIYDIFDFYVDAFTVPGKLKQFVKYLDFKAIEYCDAVILTNEARCNQIKGSVPKKLEIIHNTPGDYKDAPVPFRKKTEASSLSIAYVGILQPSRSLLEMIEVVKNKKEWKFSIAGFGSLTNKINNMSCEHENIDFRGRVSYQTGLDLSLQSDVLFAIYDPNIPNHKYSSPNKLYEAMMLGKPIIVAQGTGVDEIVLKEQMGFSVEYGNLEQLERVLSILENNEELYKELSRNARKAYEHSYSWEQMSKKLLQLYKSI